MSDPNINAAPKTGESDKSEASSEEAVQRILVRLGGDVTTKARVTRRYFTKRLVNNIKDSLRQEGISSRVERTHDRIFVNTNRAGGAPSIQRVFGIQSLSVVETRNWHSLDDLVREGLALFGETVRGRRFAVRARRVGDRRRIPVDAREVERELGAALFPNAAGVDLDNPEVTVFVEVLPGRACFHAETLPGRGGLPLGVEGRAVALVSGGFDSAVAVWQLLKRGVAQDYVFCNLGGRSHQLGTLRVMKVIADQWCYGTRPRFHAIEFEGIASQLQAKTETRYWQVLLKRLMLRAAEQIAAERGAVAIITGEAVGQVSSQTLQNLAAISEATSLPILRPLIGFNKDEILEVARDIGTYDLSKVVGEYCAMVPRRPATAATLAAMQAEEAKLDLDDLRRAVDERTIFDLRALDLAALDIPDLAVERIPEGATVIDLRSKAAFETWHYPDAVFLDFPEALRAYPHFERGGRYVLYCEFGLKSAHLAELMRQAGFEAHHVAGGLREIRKQAPA